MAFHATSHQAKVASGSDAILSLLHLGELPLNLLVFFSFIRTWHVLIVLAGLTKALGNPDGNPNDPLSVDLARIGLGAPPRPPLGGATPRPSGLGLDGDKGCFLLLVFHFCTIFYFRLADFWLLF